MASIEVREDIVQLTVAAYDAGPDAALMRELEAIIDAQGGSLLEVAEALTAGARWGELYPDSQTAAEFSDAWLGTLLPGVGADLLEFGRDIVVAHLEGGGDRAGLVLAAQAFLSDPAVPADFAGFAGDFLARSGTAMAALTAAETREDLVQLAVAAHGAAPDPALMAELDAVIDGGGGLLDAAEALTAGARWMELYPDSQTSAEFSDAWLEALLPGVGAELLAAGREIVVPVLDAGGDAASLVLLAQRFLSGIVVPAEFAGFAEDFLERGEDAAAELAAAEARQDIVQLAVAAYDAAPGAALMEELEAAVDGGGTLLEAAETLVEGERWAELYPAAQTAEEFADAWLARLLPGLDASTLAARRTAVLARLEAGDGFAAVVLEMQEFLSGDDVPAAYADAAAAFLNKAEVAQEHSVAQELDGMAAELRAVLEAVTEDPATVQAAIDALDDMMPGDMMPGDMMPGDMMPGDMMAGGGGQTPSPGGGGSGGGGQTPSPGGGGSGGGGQTPSPGGGGSGGGGQAPAPSSRDATDGQGRVVQAEFDEDEDGTYDRAEAYEYGAGDLKTKITWYDDWALEADGSGKSLDMQTADRALFAIDDDGDGAGDSRRHETYAADGETVVRSLFDDDNADDGSWERAEGYEYDAAGRTVLEKRGTVDGADPESAAVDYGEAEIHILNAAGEKTETRFFDAYDGTSDFAMLEAGTAGRIRSFGADLDGDGSADDSKTESFDDGGRVAKVTIDHDTDGAIDRIEEYTYSAADARWLSFSEDFDGDGTVDLKTTVARRGAGDELATRERAYDDGSGGKTADDGAVDKIVHETFGAFGVDSTKHDDDGDGTWDRGDRRTRGSEDKLLLAEFDENGDGVYTKAEAYRYDAAAVIFSPDALHPDIEIAKSRTDFFDNWSDANGVFDVILLTADRTEHVRQDYEDGGSRDDSKTETRDGGGRVVRVEYDHDSDGAVNRIEERTYSADPADARWLTFSEDFDGDGTVDMRTTVTHRGAGLATREKTYDDGSGGKTADDGTFDKTVHETFDATGLTVSAKHDDDGDGAWDRGDRRTRDGVGRDALAEFDENGDGTYTRAEAYGYDAVRVRADHFDSWDDGKGVSDLPSLRPDRSEHFMRDFDGDGSADDAKTELFDAGGRVTKVTIDQGADETPDRIEEYTYNAADTADARWLTFSEDFDGDGAVDVKTTVTHHGAGTFAATRERAYDDGTGGKTADDGTADKIVHETFGAGGGLESTKHDDDGDGVWDRTVDVVSEDATDDKARVALRQFDDDGDGTHDRAEAYEYGAGDLKVKTTWYDDWAVKADGAAEALADQAISRTLTVADDDADGTGESRRHDTYRRGEIVQSLFDDDNAADGSWERAEGYALHLINQQRTMLKTGETVAGTDPAAAAVEWDKAEIYILGLDGTEEIRFFDAYDGVSDIATLKDGVASRIHRFRLDLENVGGTSDARFDKLDGRGRIVESLFDIDKDGVERAEAYAWDAGGRKTEVRFFDPHTGTFDLSSASPGKIHGWTYSAEDLVDARWLSFSEDLDGDGTADRTTAVTYKTDDDNNLLTRTVRHDDGSGSGTADDGTIDRVTFEFFAPGGFGPIDTLWEDGDGDGAWDRLVRNTRDDRDRVVLAEFDDDGDANGRDHVRAEAYAYDDAGAKIRTDFYGDWDDPGAFAVDLSALNADKSAHRMRELDGDGSADDARTEFFDEAGRTTKIVFDYDSDDAVDRIEEYAYGADAADARWLSFSEDFDGDGTADLETAVTYHGGTRSLAAREKAYDDGSGSGTADDGTVDKRVYESFDASGVPLLVKHDNDGDGTWDATDDAISRHTKDGEMRVVLSEIDSDGNGVYDRAVAFEYGPQDLAVKTTWYDDWEVGADGAGKGLADQTIDRVLTVADENDDGTGESRRLDTRDADGKLVIESLFDDDNAADGEWDRAEGYEHDAAGRRILFKAGDVAVSDPIADPADVEIGWSRARIDILNSDGGTSESRFFDAYDGTSDFAVLKDGTPDSIRRFGLELDGDGGDDDARYDKLDAAGRVVESLFDLDSDGGVDRAESYGYDIDDEQSKILINFHDSWTGTFDLPSIADRTKAWEYGFDGTLSGVTYDNDNDLQPDQVIRYEYHDNGEILSREVEIYGAEAQPASDAGGFGVPVGPAGAIVAITGDADVNLNTIGDPEGGGGSYVLFTHNDKGVLERAEIDYDYDDIYDQVEIYVHHANGELKTRTARFDDGSGGADADDGTADRTALTTFDEAGLLESVKYDDDGDGTDDRTETHFRTRHAGGGIATLTVEYDNDADDAVDRISLETYDADGRLLSIKHDNNNDGTDDLVETYAYAAGALETWETRIDGGTVGPAAEAGGFFIAVVVAAGRATGDGTVDSVLLRTYGADGILSAKGDFDADGTHDQIETYVRHANGALKTRTANFDDGSGGGTADDGTVDRSSLTTFDESGRLESVKHDDGDDGVFDRVETYAYDGAAPYWSVRSRNRNAAEDDVFERVTTVERDARGAITKETIEFDDGLGAGTDGKTADDGTVDRRQENAFDASTETPQLSSSKYDNDNDGTWDVEDAFVWTGGVAEGPSMVTRTAGGVAAPAAGFIYGTGGADTATGTAAADWIDAGKGDDAVTGGAGADVLIFRRGDGTDVVTDFAVREDRFWIRTDGFHPDDAGVEFIQLTDGNQAMYPYIPATHFPAAGDPAVDAAVVAYGGDAEDRIVLLGVGGGNAEFILGHIQAHGGEVLDLTAAGGFFPGA